jgi:hypothetical protein
MARRAGLIACVVAIALGRAAAVRAGGGDAQIKFNPADQAAARAVLIRRSDLGSTGWEGGRVKPDLAGGPSCPNYHPNLSDLVITGAAKSAFRRSGFEFDSTAEVLKTRRMVTLDWRRSVLAPGVVPCLRQTLARGLGSSAKVISFRKLPFPPLATHTALFRGVIGVQAQGQTVRVLADTIVVGRLRTEITLGVAGPAAATKAISAAERRLVRVLVSRARA